MRCEHSCEIRYRQSCIIARLVQCANEAMVKWADGAALQIVSVYEGSGVDQYRDWVSEVNVEGH